MFACVTNPNLVVYGQIRFLFICGLILLFFIQLVPGYRGYTIDSIRQLTILDDIRISADEKHFFKGLSKLKGI